MLPMNTLFWGWSIKQTGKEQNYLRLLCEKYNTETYYDREREVKNEFKVSQEKEIKWKEHSEMLRRCRKRYTIA
jgi:hypothetical protein